jgi:hypothetical protein
MEAVCTTMSQLSVSSTASFPLITSIVRTPSSLAIESHSRVTYGVGVSVFYDTTRVRFAGHR